jgi:hypothetical protein
MDPRMKILVFSSLLEMPIGTLLAIVAHIFSAALFEFTHLSVIA